MHLYGHDLVYTMVIEIVHIFTLMFGVHLLSKLKKYRMIYFLYILASSYAFSLPGGFCVSVSWVMFSLAGPLRNTLLTWYFQESIEGHADLIVNPTTRHPNSFVPEGNVAVKRPASTHVTAA